MFLFASVVANAASFRLAVDAGIAFNTVNDVRIPGDTGTKFSIADDLDVKPAFASRIRLSAFINDNHEFSMLLAPLTLLADGRAPADIDFDGETFPAGTDLNARYMFNSWRIGWRYYWTADGDPLTLGLGFTAKIRDAAVEVIGGGARATNTNVGFVPLLSFCVRYELPGGWSLLLDGDALAGPQGRAEDVFIGVERRIHETATARFGYRILEGGADNDTVYAFALLHFVVMGLDLRF